MSDFNFNTQVSRDDVVSAFQDNSEEAAYVFGEFALMVQGTMDRDDFLDCLQGLNGGQKSALADLARAIIDRTEGDE